MARLVFAPAAEEDLRQIVDYIGRDKPQAARQWLSRMRNKCRLLAQHTEIGERVPEFLSGECRTFVVGRYLIFYRQMEQGIEVARIIAADRDVIPF